ncbi:DUF1566 domain-containing protein [Paraburkholderia tropica]|uniref:DUF1566 domain-containing protein n=1 Tax=Paraburkholderia tropica TaxID=92647 RepID=UPI001F1AC915|nr:DUF1566 domain-containing protein [Paraburkholderia tropica]
MSTLLIQTPELADGEVYLGGRISKIGEVQHSILIAINDAELSLDGQREWAKSKGGVLMNRHEALVIYNEHRDIVKPDWYWTDEECEWNSAYAWYQNFDGGGQRHNRKSAALRAVAVRRLSIQ